MTQINIPLGSEKGIPYGYMAYTPEGFTELGVNIHGWGERGNGTTELNMVDNVGVAKAIAEGKYPGGNKIAWVSPQYPKDKPMMYHKTLYNYIQAMCSKYNVPREIHLYGLSGGGNTVNEFISNLDANNALYQNLPPIKVKSSIMIACGPSISQVAKFLNTKLWLIIGNKDGTFDWERSKSFVDKYNSLSPKVPAKFSLLEFMGHEGPVWNNPARQPEIYRWMVE